MHQKGPVSVLVAPLDWGLGHATRCIPVIRELITQGARVSIASSGSQRSLLEMEFPELEFLELPGYQVRYRRGFMLKWGLLLRIPAILKQIRRENQWLASILETRKIDLVISDNRYGLHHPIPFCIFLTHQLSIRSGLGSLFDQLLLKWNYRFIRKFSLCWVPDWPGEVSLAGKLSHPSGTAPFPIVYIGPLSRILPMPVEVEKNSLLILISGPEPHRSEFEKIIFNQLAHQSWKCTVVRGLPGYGQPAPHFREGIRVVNHLPSAALNRIMCSSEIIITRSGYSSIMDLVQLGKKAILVPTPGQTEQEYLGYRLEQMQWMLAVPQKNFSLNTAIDHFKSRDFVLPVLPKPVLGKVIAELLPVIGKEKKAF
jgi:UDP-N-acetylglucosamine transferase subunit ALG13